MSINNVNPEYVLEFDNITKVFPGVKALDQVSLNLKPGEILTLVGENGAGKSTLINCVTGVYKPDAGEIRVDGIPVIMKNPQVSLDHGISVVHQERNLIPTFDVAENIFFDKICGKSFKPVNRKWMHENAKPLLDHVRLNLDPSTEVENLSSAQKQLIEIARALSNNSHILLLDEPTASISINEANMLLAILDDLRKKGVAIIYVSHKLEEIFAIADRVKVIRDGNSVGEAVPVNQLTRDKLIEMMVGSRELLHSFPSHDRKEEPFVLEAEGITSKRNHNPASFKLKKGEILGWYGLVGAGRTELAREIIGIDPVKAGTIKVNGKKTRIPSYKEAIKKHGIYYISENRKEEGLFLSHSIATNISAVVLKRIKNRIGLNSFKKENELVKQYAERVNIKMRAPEDAVLSLSGGNQQKVCIAKCLITEPEIIIADEPTVGIDVKTKAEIHKLIYDLSQQGKSVILISSDLRELIQISERIMVFREGSIVGHLENSKDYDVTSAKVMDAILGG